MNGSRVFVALAAIAFAGLVGPACDQESDADADADLELDAGGDADADGEADGALDGGDADSDVDADSDADADADVELDPEAACGAACSMLASCTERYASEAECLAPCLTEHDNFRSMGPPCLAAMEAFQHCWGGLSCDELDAFYLRESGSFGCAVEEAALAQACLTVGEPARESCRASCAKSGHCFPPTRQVGLAGCLRACAYVFGQAAPDGEDCSAALLASRSCGLALPCSDYSAWIARSGDEYPCRDEDLAADSACPSIEY